MLRLINEPSAASLAYNLDRDVTAEEQMILVYDLGGGTFDVSILGLDAGVFEVISTAGATHLGGEDVDQRIVDHLVAKFRTKTKLDMSHDGAAMARLKKAAEEAKITLSSQQV